LKEQAMEDSLVECVAIPYCMKILRRSEDFKDMMAFCASRSTCARRMIAEMEKTMKRVDDEASTLSEKVDEFLRQGAEDPSP